MTKRMLSAVAGLLLASLPSAVVMGQESQAEGARAVDEKAERLARLVKRIGEGVVRYQGGLFSVAYTDRMKYERVETLTRFRRVEFEDPARTLLLPVSAESLRVIEGARRPRVRTTQTFTDYRRFASDVKIVEEAEPEN